LINSKNVLSHKIKSKLSACYTECVSELDDFATLFVLVRQHWGGYRHRHIGANFNKAGRARAILIAATIVAAIVEAGVMSRTRATVSSHKP
jgi:Iap family predicted aminopeptidase